MKRLILIAAAGLALSACSHKMKPVAIDKSANPAVELDQQAQALNDAKARHVDVLSPDYYARADKEWEKAKTDLSKDKDREKVLERVGLSKAYLMEANRVADNSRGQLGPVIDAREAARAAGAEHMFEREFKNVDRDFSDLGAKFEKNKNSVTALEIEKVQDLYSRLEVKSLQKERLGPAYTMMEEADRKNARRYAPRTFEETKVKVNSAERMIEHNRSQPSVSDPAVNEARLQAEKLVFVTTYARDNGGRDAEMLAVRLWDEQRSQRRMQSRLEGELNTTRAAAARARQQSAAMQRRNEALTSQTQFQQRLQEIRDQFTEDEAEVYQQGNNVILRLKKIQFPSNRADLPAAAGGTLEKVKETIAELGGGKIIVEGHTDSIGSEEVNRRLSKQRAESVKRLLASDLSDTDIEAVGFGDTKPLSSNKTKEGRAQNRRVDIILMPTEPAQVGL